MTHPPHLSKLDWQILSGAGGLTARVPTATLSDTCGRRWCWLVLALSRLQPGRTQRPTGCCSTHPVYLNNQPGATCGANARTSRG